MTGVYAAVIRPPKCETDGCPRDATHRVLVSHTDQLVGVFCIGCTLGTLNMLDGRAVTPEQEGS